MAKMLITKSASSAHVQEPEARTGHSRTVHALTGLMENIAAVRAEILRLENLAAELRTRLHTEAYPLQSRMVEIRLETWRVLGRHYQSKQVKKKTRRILAQILEDYAFFLEDVLKVDMDGELRAVLGRGLFPPEAEALFKDFSDFLDSDADSVSDSGSSDGSSGEADAASRTTSGRSRGRPRKQKTGTESAAAPKAKTVESALAGDLRALYLMLARALHPDKETDSGRRIEKTAWMQKVTAAYGERNLADLLDILARNPLDSLGPYLSEAPLKTLQGFVKRLRRELAGLRRQIDNVWESHPPLFEALLSKGRIDERGFKKHLAEGRGFLEELKVKLESLNTLEGLDYLIRAYPMHGIDLLI